MTGTSEDNLRDFWERTAQRFAKRGFRAVCWPTSIGLVNWYIDILQRTVLKSVFHQCQGDKLLEIGCGVGRWSWRLLQIGVDVTGIDIANNMVKEARRRQLAQDSMAKAKFIVGIAEKLPFKDSVFDCVLSVTVLQHIMDEQEVKRSVLEMIRVVRPGGKIMILEASPQRRQAAAVDFPTTYRSTAEWLALFTGGKDAELVRLEGVGLSIFTKPLERIRQKFISGTEYSRQLSQEGVSIRFISVKTLWYILLNIAVLLSLPLDLVLRSKLTIYSTQKLLIFKKYSVALDAEGA